MNSYKKTPTQHNLSPVFRACLTLTVVMGGIVSQSAFAGAGWADSNGPDGGQIRVPTYYAGSPSGKRANLPTGANGSSTDAINNGGNTGKALRKFVDPLPLLGAANSKKLADLSADKYIPIAQPEKWVDGNGLTTLDDYYEIAAVEYTEKLHSDLKKPTTLRGYVQLWTPGLGAIGVAAKSFTTLDGQVISVVDVPHYLGPVINATKGVATRLKFVNMLPVGRFDGTNRKGDLFVPVDETLAGSGYGPDGLFRYTQNRANVHLHGGDNPWISDGGPHTWITPAGEANPNVPGSLASQGADPATYMRGVSAKNVPDMPDPGPGAHTYYFPNGQAARMMWYHDHTLGLTRLNVYAGMVAPYMLTDSKEVELIANGTLPAANATIPLIIQDKTFVPDDIALQDAKWNKDVNGADAKVWGAPGDLWFPHVYEFNQDPNNGLDGTSPPGRWDWGPYFWPVFPALYNVPTGAVGDVTTTPEAFMDTPVVNGVAYPKLDVEPKPYRFKILNASNDRFLNLGLYVADSAVSVINVTNGGTGFTSPVVRIIAADGGTGASATAIVVGGVITGIRVDNAGTGYNQPPFILINDGNGPGTGASATATVALNTEVKMVEATPGAAQALPACGTDAAGTDIAAPYAPACWPSTWPADGRAGGVPDPARAGPKFYQIGNETGLLPQVAEIASTPMGFEYNRRSVTVLNAFTYGLYMGNAERADVVIDFSAFKGKTLILYNDSPAPVPAFDPRVDYYTGSPDQTGAGGNEGTAAGFGPNTRTIMQIRVSNTGVAVALDELALKAAIPTAYRDSGKEAPIVAQSAYNKAFNKTWSDAPQADGTKAYANIFTGTQQEPTLKFTPGDGATGMNVTVGDGLGNGGGTGYTSAPAVTITGSGGTNPTAVSTLRMASVTMANPGAGYLAAPAVTFAAPAAGQGAPAAGYATLNVQTVAITNGGSGYTTAPAVLFSEPSVPSGHKAVGTAILTGGVVTSITITDPGAGYNVRPNILIAASDTGARATAVATAQVGGVTLTSTNPNRPQLAGGSGYTSFATNAVTIAPPPAGGTGATATVTGTVDAIRVTNAGTAVAPFAVTMSGGSGIGAAAAINEIGVLVVKNKAIQELFDPTYGRMNATLGVELPFTSALTQTTIPLGYIDPPTEALNDGETTLWKITHNGVDAHPVHFHLVNVQLINRIGWDGTIKPPQPNELGWKETVKMNPLEDIVVAMRAKKPTTAGFGLPNSIRPRDPSQPLGVPYGFTQVNPLTGNPATVVNEMQDYGWEYVWHCHILGHEENDFMRPIIFNANEAVPVAPTNLAGVNTGTGNQLTWTDNSTTEYQYKVYRAPLDINNFVVGAFVDITAGNPLLANAKSYFDSGTGTGFTYKVVAVGANGEGASPLLPIATQWAPAPALTGLTAVANGLTQITLAWDTPASQITSILVKRCRETNANNNCTAVTTVWDTLPNQISATGYVDNTAVANAAYLYQVNAVNGTSIGAVSQVAVADLLVAAPSGLTATPTSPTRVVLSWTDGSTNESGYIIERSTDGVTFAQIGVTGGGAGVRTFNDNNGTVFNTVTYNLVAGTTYTYRVRAQNTTRAVTTYSAYSNAAAASFTLPAAPTGVAAVQGTVGSGQIIVNWTDVSNNETGFTVQRSLLANNGVTWSDWGNAGTAVASATSFTDSGRTSGRTYRYQVRANGAVGNTLFVGPSNAVVAP